MTTSSVNDSPAPSADSAPQPQTLPSIKRKQTLVLTQTTPVSATKEFTTKWEKTGQLVVTTKDDDGKELKKIFNVSGGDTPFLQRNTLREMEVNGFFRKLMQEAFFGGQNPSSSHVVSFPAPTAVQISVSETGQATIRRGGQNKVISMDEPPAPQLLGFLPSSSSVSSSAQVTSSQKKGVKLKSVASLRLYKDYEQELTKKLIGKGFSAITIQNVIKKMFHEKQLDLLREVPNSELDTTIADLLQYPGNEALFALFADLADTKKLAGTAELKEPRFSLQSTREKKCREAILDFIFSKTVRPERVIKNADGSCITQTMYQGTGTANTRTFTPNCAFSSETDKRARDNPGFDEHCTNLGVTRSIGKDGASEVVSVRSGKANTKNRVEELAQFCLEQELESKDKFKALRKETTDSGAEIYTYRPQIVTHMDLGKWKSFGSKFGAGEPEFDYTMEITRAIDKWPPEGLLIEKTINGKSVQILMLKPTFADQQFSSQVVGWGTWENPKGLGQERADNFNVHANGQYFQDYLRDCAFTKEETNSVRAASRALSGFLFKKFGVNCTIGQSRKITAKDGKKIQLKVPAELQGMVDFDKISAEKLYELGILDNKLYKDYCVEVNNLLLKKLKEIDRKLNLPNTTEQETTELLAVRDQTKAMYALHFRRLPPPVDKIDSMLNFDKHNFPMDPPTEEVVHAADMEVYRNILCNPRTKQGVKKTKAKQCKSGVDRTGLDNALTTAQKQFYLKYGKDFVPGDIEACYINGQLDPTHPAYEELLWYKKFFREALIEFGVPVVIETKGFSGLRWAEGLPPIGGSVNSVPHIYMFLREDEPYLGLVGLEGQERDVDGLTYEDLRNHRSLQYKGSLHTADEFYLQSDPSKKKKTQKEIKEILKEKTSDNITYAQRVVDRVHVVVEKEIFNDALQLKIHISDLELTNNKIKKIEDRIEQLDRGLSVLQLQESGFRKFGRKLGVIKRDKIEEEQILNKFERATLLRILATKKRADRIKNPHQKGTDTTGETGATFEARRDLLADTMRNRRFLAPLNVVMAAEERRQYLKVRGKEGVVLQRTILSMTPEDRKGLLEAIPHLKTVLRKEHPDDYQQLGTIERELEYQISIEGFASMTDSDVEAALKKRVTELESEHDRLKQLKTEVGKVGDDARKQQVARLVAEAQNAQADFLPNFAKSLSMMIKREHMNKAGRRTCERLLGIVGKMLVVDVFTKEQIDNMSQLIKDLKNKAKTIGGLNIQEKIYLKRWLDVQQYRDSDSDLLKQYKTIIEQLNAVARENAEQYVLEQIEIISTDFDDCGVLIANTSAIIDPGKLFSIIKDRLQNSKVPHLLLRFCEQWVIANKGTTAFTDQVHTVLNEIEKIDVEPSSQAFKTAKQQFLTELGASKNKVAVAPKVGKAANPVIFQSIIAKLLKTRFNGADGDKYQENVNKIAKEFTSMQQAYLDSLSLVDINPDCSIDGVSPNVQQYQQFLHKLTAYVSNQVLELATKEEQRRVIKFFINIAEKCIQDKDEITTQVIARALNSLPQPAKDVFCGICGSDNYKGACAKLKTFPKEFLIPQIYIPQAKQRQIQERQREQGYQCDFSHSKEIMKNALIQLRRPLKQSESLYTAVVVPPKTVHQLVFDIFSEIEKLPATPIEGRMRFRRIIDLLIQKGEESRRHALLTAKGNQVIERNEKEQERIVKAIDNPTDLDMLKEECLVMMRILLAQEQAVGEEWSQLDSKLKSEDVAPNIDALQKKNKRNATEELYLQNYEKSEKVKRDKKVIDFILKKIEQKKRTFDLEDAVGGLFGDFG